MSYRNPRYSGGTDEATQTLWTCWTRPTGRLSALECGYIAVMEYIRRFDRFGHLLRSVLSHRRDHLVLADLKAVGSLVKVLSSGLAMITPVAPTAPLIPGRPLMPVTTQTQLVFSGFL
jgi:hypothetical protein